MPTDLLLSLIGFAFASSITPGPNNLLVLTSGLNHGVRRSLPLVAGISVGFALMLAAVGAGLGAVLRASPGLHVGAKLFGLAYMLGLAWKVATSAPEFDHGDEANRSQQPLSALAGALFQWVNPKAWAVALSATAAFALPNAMLAGLSWVSLVFLLVAFGSLSAWAAFGSMMRRIVDDPERLRTFNIAMALLLAASALPIAYDLLQT